MKISFITHKGPENKFRFTKRHTREPIWNGPENITVEVDSLSFKIGMSRKRQRIQEALFNVRMAISTLGLNSAPWFSY